MTQYAFHFNSDVCTGCKTCQVACKETYKLPVNNLYRKVYNYQGGSWKPTEAGHYVPEGVFGYFVSHGLQPLRRTRLVWRTARPAPCTKDEETGIVWTRSRRVHRLQDLRHRACPYGAPTFVEEEGVHPPSATCAPTRSPAIARAHLRGWRVPCVPWIGATSMSCARNTAKATWRWSLCPRIRRLPASCSTRIRQPRRPARARARS